MANHNVINFRVAIDVDRRSPRYQSDARDALDPEKRGSGLDDQTVKNADEGISRGIAFDAVKHLLHKALPESFGGSTVRIVAPKNMREAIESMREAVKKLPANDGGTISVLVRENDVD